MNRRWVTGFTLVELTIVIAVISILATLSVVGYNGIRVAAAHAAAKSDLQNVNTVMQMAFLETGAYPTTLPDNLKPSDTTKLDIKWSGTVMSYDGLTPVQNGVLLSTICQTLISEGGGQGANQAGQTQNYITGCGNWNRGSMQVTGWSTKVWNTPVTSQQLSNYGTSFTTSDTWNASQAPVTKNFYAQLVQRHTSMGGTFPITSFWDSWANSNNGGTMYQALPAPTTRTGYCIEATVQGSGTGVWHIGDDGALREGACEY